MHLYFTPNVSDIKISEYSLCTVYVRIEVYCIVPLYEIKLTFEFGMQSENSLLLCIADDLSEAELEPEPNDQNQYQVQETSG